MQNGTYKARLRASNTTGELRVNNGIVRWYVQGRYVRDVKDIGLYEVGEKVKGKDEGRYDIEWWNGGKLMERIRMNGSYALCRWKIGELSRSTHKSGVLIVVRCL